VETGEPFDDDAPFRRPPSPEDRLWRHPSELAWSAPPAEVKAPRHPGAALAVASGVAGAILAVGAVALTGSLDTRVDPDDTRSLQRQATLPVVATSAVDNNDTELLARTVAPSIVLLHIDGNEQHTGSGVVFRDDGHVLTNAHVVASAATIGARLADGRRARVKVVATDLATDLAVLKLTSGGPFVPASLGTSDGVAVGDPTLAVGANVASGVISALGREITTDGRTLEDLIQTDAPIDPTSSGGALLRSDGTVIGITTAWASGSRMGFATPVDVARAVAEELLAAGRVRTVWLGIKGTSAPDGGGVVIAELVPEGPAHAAGLVVGDVVRRIDGHPVSSMSHLRIVLRRSHPGDAVRVVLDRGGHRHEMPVVLAERSSSS
jgi:putative serine protease PepD